MLVLELHFESSNGKSARLSIDQPSESLNSSEIKTAMETIIQSGVFVDSDGNLFEQIKGARLIERKITEFDLY